MKEKMKQKQGKIGIHSILMNNKRKKEIENDKNKMKKNRSKIELELISEMINRVRQNQNSSVDE